MAQCWHRSETIGYIEAHSTGTSIGDPIEVAGLTRHSLGQRHVSSALGSVKSNVGHCEAAAGMAGVLKLYFRFIINVYPRTNISWRRIGTSNLKKTPFYFVDGGRPNGDEEVCLGLRESAFGFGGTNVHVVIEEPSGRRAMRHPLLDLPAF
ncbi:MAG: hypothetical protein U1D30_11675 [Planctomycetota bacterium]